MTRSLEQLHRGKATRFNIEIILARWRVTTKISQRSVLTRIISKINVTRKVESSKILNLGTCFLLHYRRGITSKSSRYQRYQITCRLDSLFSFIALYDQYARAHENI